MGASGSRPAKTKDGIVIQQKHKLSDIYLLDQRKYEYVDSDDPLFNEIDLQPGETYTTAELQETQKKLASGGLFEKVGLVGDIKTDGTIDVIIQFKDKTWEPAEKFRCVNVGLMPQREQLEVHSNMTEREILDYNRAEKDYYRSIDISRPCRLPVSVCEEVSQMLRNQEKVTTRLLSQIRDRVEKWYRDEGYVGAHVTNFGNLNSKDLVGEVVEGDITQRNIQFHDEFGNVCKGNTQLAVLTREMPKTLKEGQVYNTEACKEAWTNINSLDLFSTIEIKPRQDEKNRGGIIVDVNLKELEPKFAAVSPQWTIVPGRGCLPTLASFQPGGTISFGIRNLKGLNRSILGSVTSSNFLNPENDMSFDYEYVHPYLDGITNPRNRTLRTSCFNSRKQCPVFTGGPGWDDVPPIWVDRVGVQAKITETFTEQSQFTYGLVMEEITTRNESSDISPNGFRVLPSGEIGMDGPPTTLSSSGTDQIAYAQANITRDTTKLVNGAIVGARNVLQLDQGISIESNFPIFNRHQLTLTRFIQLKQVEEGDDKPPPPVLVLHGHYGGCIGDLPSYDAFTLGGPNSVRGYRMGEIGAARNIVELAAELRIPVGNTHAYTFVEHGNDLGSSKDVKGNPTEAYRRMGHGSSYGLGVKLGSLPAEYVTDNHSGTGALSLQFGERF